MGLQVVIALEIIKKDVSELQPPAKRASRLQGHFLKSDPSASVRDRLFDI